MRTIKFRGKSIFNEWVYGNLHIEYATIIVHRGYRQDDYYPIDIKTVGQFTGLMDKNGNEIYEGDILKVYYCGKSKVFGVVRFDEARFYIDDDFKRNELKVKAPMTKLFSHYQFEVIGNIHDNPKLMKRR